MFVEIVVSENDFNQEIFAALTSYMEQLVIYIKLI